MLFNSGNPSLVDKTRAYIGDPSTAPSTLWSLQEVKNAINTEYLELVDLMRHTDAGWGVKIAYATSVAGTIYYTTPSDLVHFNKVEIDPDGNDLSTASNASVSPIKLLPRSVEDATEAYHQNKISTSDFYAIKEGEYGIFAPPSYRS